MREFRGDVRVIFGDVIAFLETPRANLHRAEHVASCRVNHFWRGGFVSRRRQIQNFFLRFGQQVIAIDHNTILRIYDSHAARFFRGRGNFRLTNLQKCFLDERERLDVFNAHRGIDNAAHVFFCASPRRDDSRAKFDQPDISLRRRNNARRVHGDFTAAAQRESRRRDNNRLRRIAHPHIHALQLANLAVERIP